MNVILIKYDKRPCLNLNIKKFPRHQLIKAMQQHLGAKKLKK